MLRLLLLWIDKRIKLAKIMISSNDNLIAMRSKSKLNDDDLWRRLARHAKWNELKKLAKTKKLPISITRYIASIQMFSPFCRC